MTALALLAVIAGTTAAHHQIPSTSRVQQSDAFVPRPDVAKLMALGFDTLLADYYWVQAVLLSGGSNHPAAHSAHLGRLIDVVTTLDPWVDHPYRFAAVWLIESLDEVRHANRLLERSFEYHPDEWRNRFYLGFNLFFYFDEYGQAADWLHEASQLPGSPPYLTRLVARLRSHSADLTAAAMFLEEMVRNAPDESSKAAYQAALDEIEIEWKARELDRAREAYNELWGEDIEFVEQLYMGSKAVIVKLPDPEPSALPPQLSRGSVWVIDEEDGRIESTYYGRRYEVHVDPINRKERARLRAEDARRRSEGQREREREQEEEEREEERDSGVERDVT